MIVYKDLDLFVAVDTRWPINKSLDFTPSCDIATSIISWSVGAIFVASIVVFNGIFSVIRIILDIRLGHIREIPQFDLDIVFDNA